MTPALQRFLRYAAFDTQSSSKTGTHPSTPGQLVLADAIADELRALGARDVRRSADGYVYAAVPASPGRQGEPALGFVAHLGTAAEASGAEGFEPRLSAVRGGTDGATLPWRGIPCPNIGFGGLNCHGEMEFPVVEEFEAALRVVLRLACGSAAHEGSR